jgi:hypothetical protein
VVATRRCRPCDMRRSNVRTYVRASKKSPSAATTPRSTLHHDFPCRDGAPQHIAPRFLSSFTSAAPAPLPCPRSRNPTLAAPPLPPPPPRTRIEDWWGNACAWHCYIFIFLNPEDIPPGGKISKTLCKTTQNAWGNAIPHGVSEAMQFPMG